VSATPRDIKIPEDKDVHFRAQQTIKRFFGTAYHQFIFVKGGIEDQRDRGQAAELRDQLNSVRRYSAECWATKRADYYDRVMISQVWLSVVKPSNSRIASPRVVAASVSHSRL
jgi:hypothetical protein